jgi:thiamine kinase-like enzyme
MVLKKLDLNHKYLMTLVRHFNIGQVKNEPLRVEGGLLHIMWRLDTSTGSYAIKQLSKKVDLKNKNIIKNYELTEHVAFLFASQGVPAVYAIEENDKHLFIADNVGYLVYPWINAKALDKDAVSQACAIEIARVLANMHHINLNVNEIAEAKFDIHDNQVIIDLVSLAKKKDAVFSVYLLKHLEELLEINQNYHHSIVSLKSHTVISHGDLDQKNVLWNEANYPFLIDWESARRLNPTYEIINAALDWSGIATKFNKSIFIAMIQSYEESGGAIDRDNVDAALWGVLGNWINWMLYNINRAVTSADPEQKNIGIEQVNQTLSTILRIKDLVSELLVEISEKRI